MHGPFATIGEWMSPKLVYRMKKRDAKGHFLEGKKRGPGRKERKMRSLRMKRDASNQVIWEVKE